MVFNFGMATSLEEKPFILRLKIDLVSHSTSVEGLGKFMRGKWNQ